MIENYKLAFIGLLGLLVSCCLSNAMEQQGSNRKRKLHQNAIVPYDMNENNKREECFAGRIKRKRKERRERMTKSFEVLRSLVGGKSQADVLQLTVIELSTLKTKNLPDSELARRNQELKDLLNKELVRYEQELNEIDDVLVKHNQKLNDVNRYNQTRNQVLNEIVRNLVRCNKELPKLKQENKTKDLEITKLMNANACLRTALASYMEALFSRQ